MCSDKYLPEPYFFKKVDDNRLSLNAIHVTVEDSVRIELEICNISQHSVALDLRPSNYKVFLIDDKSGVNPLFLDVDKEYVSSEIIRLRSSECTTVLLSVARPESRTEAGCSLVVIYNSVRAPHLKGYREFITISNRIPITYP